MADKFKKEFRNADQKHNVKTALHYVYHEIDELHNTKNPEDVRKRWIWELLQNAHDARGADGIKAEVRYDTKDRELIFLHNGRGFEADEIVHLIKAGTTKDKDEDGQETYGKFGRGFLTTHLLSPTVKVAGQLYDNSWFNFTLERNFIPGRDNESKNSLAESLEGSLDAFEESISDDNKPAIPEGFTTQFIFQIHGTESKKAVEEGIDLLKQCAPYLVVFNREFFSINIKESDKAWCFKLNGDSELDASGIRQVTVVENDTKKEYLLAENKQQKTSIAVPMKSNTEKPVCLEVGKIPKLFSAFPLVGTKLLSFPAVINNPDFLLPANRDGVQFDKNRPIFEEACNLLINLIEHAALKCWNHVHHWAKIPYTEVISGQMGSDWEDCIKDLIERIRLTPAVHTLSDELKSPISSVLPWTETERGENIVALWDLLKDWRKYREKLPRRSEVAGWYNAIKSWEVCEHEAFDGDQLAQRVQDCSRLNVLQDMLQEGVCAVKWLDRFYNFLKKDELFNNTSSDYSFVPNQLGEFCKLSSLDRDNCIDEELKDISKILGKNIRASLRYTPLTSLEDIDDGKDLDNEGVVGDLIDDLENNTDESYEKFRETSVRLFAWIVRNKQYARLPGFTVFAKDANSEKPTIIRLSHPKPDDDPDMELPLAPIKAWDNKLQNYDELFPRRFIMHKAFYDAVPEEDIWQTLDKKKIIRKDVIIRYRDKVSFDVFQPRDPLSEEVEHESKKQITVSNIAFLTKKDSGIIDTVRKIHSLPYKFWCFLTEWVAEHDVEGLEIIEDITCTCGDTHRCYPAQWLKHVVDRKWVALDEGGTDYVKAEVLVNLLQDNNWDPSTLIQNDSIGKLLEAIGISPLDFIRETLVDKNDHKAVDDAMIEIVRKSDGNVNHINHAIKYIEAVNRNENLPQQVDILLKTTGGDLSEVTEIVQDLEEDENFSQDLKRLRDRRHNINENRSVGNHVEGIVRRILEDKLPSTEFNVDSVHEGADFEITITQGGRKFWIEVKSTRIEGGSQGVKMSSSQAKKAVEEKENFLLCVVPIPAKPEADIDTVEDNMLFIANIGEYLTHLYENIKQFEKAQAKIKNPTHTSSDVELVVGEGKPSVLVKKSVWEKDGFRHAKLLKHLMLTDNDLAT